MASSVANPENPPWGIPGAILVWLLSIALLFVVPNLFVAPYVAYHFHGRPAPTEQILEERGHRTVAVRGRVADNGSVRGKGN